jgi:CTP:molybdopterin cytidylyltransferase MocA
MLRFRDRTFLQTIVDSSHALGLKPIVVLGNDAANIKSCHDLTGVTVVRNTVPESGPIGSIQVAVRTVLNHPIDALLVWPVDLPHVKVDTVRSLVDGFRISKRPIVVPFCSGRRGHPVVFGRAVFEELLRAPDSEGAGAVVRADSTRVLEVPVTDTAVLSSLNRPEDYRELLRSEDLAEG